MADHNIEGQLKALLHVFEGSDWKGFWADLRCPVYDFQSLGLDTDTLDSDLWRLCQARRLMLLTANRNRKGEDSLEETIRALNTPESLPVITMANPDRVRLERSYAERVAVRLLEILMDIQSLLGTGRLFIP